MVRIRTLDDTSEGGDGHESESVGQAPLLEVQDRQAQGRVIRDLQEP